MSPSDILLSMSQLYLFNPENDLSLAHGKAQYTAPPNALHLHDAGAILPLWLCDENDKVIADLKDIEWVSQIKSLFDIKGDIATKSNIENVTKCCPWGWSLHAKKQLLNFGVDNSLLLTDADIEEIRTLSHRRTSIEVLSNLNTYISFPDTTYPFEATNENAVIDYARKHQQIFIKSPWSSSGRGVINASNISEQELRRRAGGIIRRQGSVICEKALDKVIDFAMLFYSDGKKVEFLGFSSFFNEGTGAYAGNIIASQQTIFQSLNKFSVNIDLIELSQLMERVLAFKINGKYSGYLGVDMMIYRDKYGKHAVAPCIEVNMRMTMGVVALLWSEKHLFPSSIGVMRVEYKFHKKEFQKYNKDLPIIVDRKLKSGTISLIPPDDYFEITIKI